MGGSAHGRREPGRRRRARRAGPGLAWSLVAVAGVVTASRWLDVASVPLVRLQLLVPWVGALAVPALLGLLSPATGARARAALGVVCLTVLLVQAATWLPWLTGEQPRAGRRLTVMALNVYEGRADMDAVAGLVRGRRVDVLVLCEVPQGTRFAVRSHALSRLLPHATPPTTASAQATVIRSRLPLATWPGADGVPAAARPRHPVAAVHVGTRVALRGVHPEHPASSRTARLWEATLRELADWANGTAGPLVLAGDFNATVDHPGLRHVLAAGRLRDAHEVAGAGRPPTWPHGHLYPAFVHIDHVLVRGLDVAAVEDVRVPGSDHDAVIAHLVVPAADAPGPGVH